MTAGWRGAAFVVWAYAPPVSAALSSAAWAHSDPAVRDHIGICGEASRWQPGASIARRGSRMIGDAYFNVRTDDPRYQEIERHVGAIQPGETKPFRPWPE
jgi:hypothetical protein